MTMRFKFTTLALMLLSLVAYGFSQKADKTPTTTTTTTTTTTQNLVRGVSGPVNSNSSWSGYTLWGVVPGSALFPISSTTTVFSYGFTAGSEADVTSAVLYTTARGSTTITAVTPVTYQSNSSFSIDLASTSVCPTAPSTSPPCIVKFDPITLTLSPASDYYFALYFTGDDSNNSAIAGTSPTLAQSSLWGWYNSGNYTNLIVGNSIPVPGGNHSAPYFLMYVTNN
jgi:hypothetical protein